MNFKFVLRGFLLSLALLTLVTMGLALLPQPTLRQIIFWFITRPPDPTPPPPAIAAPRGELPNGVVGLQEWAQYSGTDYAPVGSAFLLGLEDGTPVGVTTAHSVDLGNPARPLERIAFTLPGQLNFIVECDTLYGRPGSPGTAADAYNMVIDWLLLKIADPVEASLLLTADPRGAPQPGERVVLFSGLGDGAGGQRPLTGTVQSLDALGGWVLMDETFDASGMSGSPILSQHTGQVVGMTMAVTLRRDRILIGFHPIGHLVELAESATEFPKLAEYRVEVNR
jgi:hypothetical protein